MPLGKLRGRYFKIKWLNSHILTHDQYEQDKRQDEMNIIWSWRFTRIFRNDYNYAKNRKSKSWKKTTLAGPFIWNRILTRFVRSIVKFKVQKRVKSYSSWLWPHLRYFLPVMVLSDPTHQPPAFWVVRAWSVVTHLNAENEIVWSVWWHDE